MGEEIYEEQAESSIDNLQMEQISEAQLTKVVTTFCEKLDKLAGDVAYALAGGDFDKGMSAIKEIRNEINSGAVASFYSSKQKIVGMLAKGAKYGNSLTAEEQNNFDNTLAFLEAYRKFTPVFIGYNKILNLLESGALDCSYLNFLFVIYFDMIGMDKEFSYEISCVFRDFEELAEYYKNMDVDADYLAYTYFDAHTKEFERMERELDQKMSQTHPDAYKYLSPFRMHSVYEGLGKMKTIDNWTQQYRFMMKDVSKFHEAYKVIKENGKTLGYENIDIILSDSLAFLSENHCKFSIIFVDPPYKLDVYEKVVETLIKGNMLEENGIIVLESERELNLDSNMFKSVRFYKYGLAKIYIIRN